MAAREILTQLVHRKGREQLCSYLYSGYLKSWPGSSLPTTLLPSHLAKPIPESEVRRKILKGLARTRQGEGQAEEKKRKGISHLLLWEDLYLLPLIKTSAALSLQMAPEKGREE